MVLKYNWKKAIINNGFKHFNLSPLKVRLFQTSMKITQTSFLLQFELSLGIKTWELLWEEGRPQPGSKGQKEVGRGTEVTTVYNTHASLPPLIDICQRNLVPYLLLK